MCCNRCDRKHKYRPSTHFSDHLISSCPGFQQSAAWDSKDVLDAIKKQTNKIVRYSLCSSASLQSLRIETLMRVLTCSPAQF